MYFNPVFERWVACWIWIHYALVMNFMEYEIKATNQGFRNISGVDEAGRGPLAGPVVAAAVIFSPNIDIVDLDDSKK